MSAPLGPATRTVVFADPAAELWGVARDGAAAALGCGALAPGSRRRAVHASFEVIGADAGEWRIAGRTFKLTVSPAGERALSASEGFTQLCEVRGTVREDSERELCAFGLRELAAPREGRCLGSVRGICAWFGPADGLALTAVRPPDSAGHDADSVSAAVFEADRRLPVADPRLSTTYRADGSPARVGVELLLEADEDDTPHYPWRAVGEGLGAVIDLSGEGVARHAYAMRWHSRGRDGFGAYLLTRPA